MSDSEDDYMSFKVLSDCQSADIRPSLLVNREKRKHEIFKKKLDSSYKRQKSVRELERENLEKGLKTAIPSENKGFKLLEKMGFKAGESLGKSKTGLKEPIDISVKQGTSGVGRESHINEMVFVKRQQKIKNLKRYETQYRLANKERNILFQMRKDFFKAQKICEELDFRKDIKEPLDIFFWTKEAIKNLKKKSRSEDTDSSDEDDDEDFEHLINEENLCSIIDYIRSKHLYCLYCAITGSDVEDLKENCPGPYRVDHDDLD